MTSAFSVGRWAIDMPNHQRMGWVCVGSPWQCKLFDAHTHIQALVGALPAILRAQGRQLPSAPCCRWGKQPQEPCWLEEGHTTNTWQGWGSTPRLTRLVGIFIFYLTEMEIEAQREKGVAQGFPGQSAAKWGWESWFLNLQPFLLLGWGGGSLGLILGWPRGFGW